MSEATTESLTQTTIGVARRVWATALVRGVLFLVLGLVMYLWPDVGGSILTWLIAILFALQAIILFVEAGRLRGTDADGAKWRTALGALAAAAAVAVLLWTEDTFTLILRAVAIWALVAGVMGVISAVRGFRARRPNWDWELTSAVFWVLFGVLVLVKPLDDVGTVITAMSVFLIFTGVVLTVGGYSLQVSAKDARTGAAGAPAAPASAAAPAPAPAQPPSRGTASSLEQAPRDAPRDVDEAPPGSTS
ncbi:HdeD family acid-resistance protein [Cellulomonas sp. PhB143]|uniref:HdeD family acid-resistance protein n=1 Tax=Cellulomonas sp. PhB143 TaxID=2485186 RepID=UPI000F47021C|nr:DUF308 domain-containing protein [Cellulomonas sp. PhB143]ROS79050.1 uncharacterized membrane protein HdeD (DUF308 family) [Cellulomonas sp. PhB143]